MTFFGSLQHKIIDGAAGLAPPGNPLAVVAGIADQGTIGEAVLIGKEGDLSVFGTGPLVDRLRDIQAEADGRLNIVAVRVTKVTEGTTGAVTKTGTGVGTQAAAGAPKRFAHVMVEATLGGGNGVAKVKYSLDGGFSWSKEAVIPGGGSVVLGDTGCTLDFTDDATPADSVDVGDKWAFFITEPTSTFAQMLTEIDPAVVAYSPAVIYLAGESDAVDWAAAAQEASDLWDAGVPTWFLMESALPDVLTAETISAWVTARVTESAAFEDLWVSVSAGLAEIFSAATGEKIRRNTAGINLGRLARIGLQASLGRVEDGPLGNVSLVDGYTNTHAQNLDDAGFTAVRHWNGLAGVFFSNGRMKAPAASDYQFQEVVRIAHKAARETRVEGLQGVGKDVDAGALAALKEKMSRPLDRMMAKVPPEILGYTLEIPAGQDIVNNGLAYVLTLEGVPVIRSLTIFQKFTYAKVA